MESGLGMEYIGGIRACRGLIRADCAIRQVKSTMLVSYCRGQCTVNPAHYTTRVLSCYRDWLTDTPTDASTHGQLSQLRALQLSQFNVLQK